MSAFCLFTSVLALMSPAFANTSSLPTTTAELFATISPEYQNIIEQLFLPDGYTLPANIYAWNVSQLVYYINSSDPTLLYTLPTDYLVELFPPYILQQLPRDVLIAHELYSFIPTNGSETSCGGFNCTLVNINNTTRSSSSKSACVYPFVETKYDTPFQYDLEDRNQTFECGLLCEYADVLWGINSDEQGVTNAFLRTNSILFLVMTVVVWINQCMDIHSDDDGRKRPSCCQRGFLYHAPMCITTLFTLMSICFLLPLFVGQQNVLCAPDIGGHYTVAMRNPQGSIGCTITGTVFYIGTLLFGLYTMAFSFVLWKQFYSPLQSLMSLCSRYRICCLCVRCVDNVVTPCVNRCESLQTSSARFSPKCQSCSDIVCNGTSFAHFVLWSIGVLMTGLAVHNRAIVAFSPLGICTVGGEKKSWMLWYNILPFTFALVVSNFFVPFAIYLLYKVVRQSASTFHKEQMRNLGTRILFYFILQEISFGVLCGVTWSFYGRREEIIKSAEQRIVCLIFKSAISADTDVCYEGDKIWPGLYILTSLVLPIVAGASVFLGCHEKTRRKWRMLLTGTPRLGNSRVTEHELKPLPIKSTMSTTTGTHNERSKERLTLTSAQLQHVRIENENSAEHSANAGEDDGLQAPVTEI